MLRSRSLSSDDHLVRNLSAPPDLDDGVQSLDYWRQRRQRLAWYQIRARREAARMTILWEQRVSAALLVQRRAPLPLRLSAGALVARTRLTRWGRRTGIAVVAATTTMLVLVMAGIVALLHAL
jgi:hypothetical protein